MRLAEAGLLKKRERRWSRNFNGFDPMIETLEQEKMNDARRDFRLGIVLAAVLHVVFFLIVFPTFEMEVHETTSQQRIYRVQQVRFQPPKPQVRKSVPKPKAKRIPIPDPTPDEPEPFYEEGSESLVADFTGVEVDLAIPDGPPGPGFEVFELTGDIIAPERTHAPRPLYPEEARLSQVQGVVILHTIIDAVGNVTDIRVLKGLPSGLTDAAVEAVSNWRFKPAMLDGKPVAVYYIVTVSFNLQ